MSCGISGSTGNLSDTSKEYKRWGGRYNWNWLEREDTKPEAYAYGNGKKIETAGRNFWKM